MWDHCRNACREQQPRSCQPDSREDAETLYQDARQSQPQRAQGTWKQATGAKYPAPQFVGDEFQAVAEVGYILNRINKADTKFNRAEYRGKWRKS